MVCPRCDGQGNIYKAKVVNLDMEIKICNECEACWDLNKTVSIENFKGLTPFLEQHGLTYDEAEIKSFGYFD